MSDFPLSPNARSLENTQEKLPPPFRARMRGASYAILDEYAVLRADVAATLAEESPFSAAAVTAAIDILFGLGLPHQYFEDHDANDIAKHVSTMMASQELSRAGGRGAYLNISQEEADSAFFAARSFILMDEHGRARRAPEGMSPAAQLERYIESRYLTLGENTRPGVDPETPSSFATSTGARVESVNAAPVPVMGSGSWRLQCYRSRGMLGDGSGSHLRLYFLQRCTFVDASPPSDETRIERLGDSRFVARTPPELMAKCVTSLRGSVRVQQSSRGIARRLHLSRRSRAPRPSLPRAGTPRCTPRRRRAWALPSTSSA